MATMSDYLTGIIVAMLVVGLFYGVLYGVSNDPNKTSMNYDNSTISAIQTMNSNLTSSLATDLQADPSNPVDLAGYFGKLLAVGGKIGVFIITAVLASFGFVASILGNIAGVPADSPFAVIGSFIVYGSAILFMAIMLKLASILLNKPGLG